MNVNSSRSPQPAAEDRRRSRRRGLTTISHLVLMSAALMTSCGPAPESKTSATERSRSTASAEAPWFEDATEASGVRFVHDVGTPGSFFMPEHVGSGAALFDYDRDGRLDLYLIHNGGPEKGAQNQLFHQEPDGRFRNVSTDCGLNVSGYGMGAAVADVNNDGWPDVLLTEFDRTRLFLNQQDGTFRPEVGHSGIDNPHWGTSASFFDYDRDGWLDLVIANYIDYAPTQKCYDQSGRLEFCGPQGFSPSISRLFRNRGGEGKTGAERFQDVTVKSGLAARPGPALGVVCQDFDGDRWPDIFVADDGKPNRLFINKRDGTFAEEAVSRGLAYNAMGQSAANMGIGVGDVDANGMFDLFVTHLTEEQHTLWMQGPQGLFMDRTAGVGLAESQWRGTAFGTVMADFDRNGGIDIAFVNGRVKRDKSGRSESIPEVAPFWSPYAQRHQLFSNDGNGRFRDVSSANSSFHQASVGRGLACGDLDNDGDVDLVVCNIGSAARILRNIAQPSGNWLLVQALDPTHGDRDAIGAEIRVRSGSKTWWRTINPAYSYLCSNDPRAHFGLGDTKAIESISVSWPNGAQEVFPGVAINQQITLRPGRGRPE